jgi:phosphatidylserine decarboxylase
MKALKTSVRRFLMTTLMTIYVLSGVFAHDNGNLSKPDHETITKKLIILVENSSDLKRLLISSIEKARKINPDPLTNPAQDLEQYYDFIDWAAKAMPWALLPKASYSGLYDQMDQGLAYFYFINDQPLDELNGKGYYHNSIQYYQPYQAWLLDFTKNWGMFLSTKDSWNDEYYKKAIADGRFGLDKGWYEAPVNWKSFNDFFSRRLASPEMRPTASPNDPSVVSAPSDSRPIGVWTIDENSKIGGAGGVSVKSKTYESVSALLGPESAYKNAFAGGTMTFEYLDEYDYHRCHSPVSGIIRETRIIKGGASAGGIITWDPKVKRYLFDLNQPGWQSLETRGCIVVETEKAGLVCLIPVGMSQMASVVFEDNVKVGNSLKKGDKLAYYLFGGSGFIMLFQKEAGFRLTAPAERDGSYRHILAGEEYGRIRKVE